MIVPHSSFKIPITNSIIDFYAERVGYDRFIPYRFVEHLAYARSFSIMKEPVKLCIEVSNQYTDSFLQLLDLIDFEAIKTYNPIEFAIRVLQILYKRVDLRVLESCAISGSNFSYEAQDKGFQNYKMDLSKLSTTQLQMVGLENLDLTTIELSQEVNDILKFYSNVFNIMPDTEKEYSSVTEPLSSYSDFYRCRKYKMVLPSFNADLAKKKLIVRKYDPDPISKSSVILAFNIAMANADSRDILSLFRAVILHYSNILEQYPQSSVTLVLVIGRVKSILPLSLPDMISIFKSPPQLVCPVHTVATSLTELGTLFPGKPVVYVSSGTGNIDLNQIKFRMYAVSVQHNDTLQRLSKLSGGRYVSLR